LDVETLFLHLNHIWNKRKALQETNEPRNYVSRKRNKDVINSLEAKNVDPDSDSEDDAALFMAIKKGKHSLNSQNYAKENAKNFQNLTNTLHTALQAQNDNINHLLSMKSYAPPQHVSFPYSWNSNNQSSSPSYAPWNNSNRTPSSSSSHHDNQLSNLFSCEAPDFLFAIPSTSTGPAGSEKPCWICGQLGHWVPLCHLAARYEILMFIMNSFYRYSLNKSRPEKERLTLQDFFVRDNVTYPTGEEFAVLKKLYEPLQNKTQRKTLGTNPKAYCHFCHATGHFTRFCKTFCCYCMTEGHSWETCTNPMYMEKIKKRKQSLSARDQTKPVLHAAEEWKDQNRLNCCFIGDNQQLLYFTDNYFEDDHP
jgi:hypothetical protein